MKTKKIKVIYLKKGDKLSSGAMVVTAPTSGISTPSGKVDIEIEYPNGKTKWQIWGKNTEVSIQE